MSEHGHKLVSVELANGGGVIQDFRAEPEIELGTDYTRVKPAIKNIAENLLKAQDRPEAPPDECWYIWHKYSNCHVAEVVSGLGQGVRVRCPKAHRTPESELRFKVLHTLRGNQDEARERVAKMKMFCAEVIDHAI